MKEQKSASNDRVELSRTSDAKPTQKKRSETPKSEENRSTSRDSDLLDSLYSSVNKSKDSDKKNHGIIEEGGDDGDEEKSSVVPSPKTEPPMISAKPKTADRANQSDGPKVKHPNTKKKRKQPNPISDSPKSRSRKVTLCNNVSVSCQYIPSSPLEAFNMMKF